MIVMAAVDNQKGLMFNHRRQSKDSKLRQKILETVSSGCLWMDAYSYAQFQDEPSACRIKVDEEFMEKAGEEDYCFLEDQQAAPYADRIEEVILYQWNRDYPADLFFDLDLDDGNFELTGSREFPGSSHEVITMEVYERA